MVSSLTSKDAAVNIESKDIEPTGLFEKAVDEKMSPLTIHPTSTSLAQEVTIRQVAPMVLVLTGATFLHVKFLPSIKVPDQYADST